jgi:hypothetical protein
MRFKLFLLVAVAALATAMPARATIVLEWHFNSTPNTNYNVTPNPDQGPGGSNEFGDYPTNAVVGPAVPGNNLGVLNAGQTVFLQVVLHQIDNVGPNVFTFNGPGTQGTQINVPPGNPGGGGLIGYGVRIDNSAPTLATHVQPSANSVNTRGTNLYGFNGNGASIVPTTGGGSLPAGSVAPFTIIRDVTTQDWFNSDGFYPLFNFRFQAAASPAGGSGTLTFADPSGGADIGSQATPNMDAAIFANAPALTFSVVPEPSSMVLAGLGLAGLGYRLRRKKVAKEEVAA